MALIIVESPTKARTFNRLLKGENYYVFATMGHIRDLPSSKLAIDYSKSFEPAYTIIKGKKKIVTELKRLAKKNKDIVLATDPDREGESIAYHIAYVLGLISENWPNMNVKEGKAVKRIVFHEITKEAIREALTKPEIIRFPLVHSQQARRILDRIVGYELSPLLWRKMGKNWLSAGRVQTVALRLIVEREKEIAGFKPEDYYQIYGFFGNADDIKAKLIKKDGLLFEDKLTISLFAGNYTYTKTHITEVTIGELKEDISKDEYTVDSIKESVQAKYPPPPFTTSLLQQDSFYRHGFSSRMTMRLAQDLYERGLITYHRTDSFNLSTNFVFRAKEYIEKFYGRDYALDKPRGYKTRSKLAQEAHEAIRPTKLEVSVDDIELDEKITSNHKKLYKLIFERSVATQMKEALIKNITISIMGRKKYLFEASTFEVQFDGYLRLLNPAMSQKARLEFKYSSGSPISLKRLEPELSKTKPPPRYNEASLIKILEEKGIGRPSTYAPILTLIQGKNYVEKENRYFIPTKLGEAISDYLSSSFPNLFNLDFTAGMEEGLDKIADGVNDMTKLLKEFNAPFQKELEEKKKDKSYIDIEEPIDEKCGLCGSPLVIRYSKYGKFLGCSKFPECKFTKPFLKVVPDKFCPKDKGRLVVRFTKSRRKFFGCENYPKCDYSTWQLKQLESPPES